MAFGFACSGRGRDLRTAAALGLVRGGNGLLVTVNPRPFGLLLPREPQTWRMHRHIDMRSGRDLLDMPFFFENLNELIPEISESQAYFIIDI